MKTIRASLLAVALFTTILAAPAHAAVSDHDLAFHWAPVHYQDTDSSDYDADYLSTVDFDGDWNGLNNWENQTQLAKLTGAAYYSVVETSTHWFIVHSFFHPRDWDDEPDPSGKRTHENDLEGALLTVRRDSGFGTLEAAVTVAHSDFYSYVPAGSPYRNGAETIDGTLLLVNGRPATRQKAKGHGLYRWDGNNFPGGDGKDNAANAPWGWDDHDDGAIYRGYLATDPALVVDKYFSNKGSFSLTYTRNAFR
ncbi:hypothetical protein [Lentzea kentuckyensis]|uniref:hypothetical protein n=1 Tax=Lentzea kentuckyensis TaxID=360086 RepID=UPI000A3A5FC4|nr:hypothetical protein [Lentzea kentuckyensis]